MRTIVSLVLLLAALAPLAAADLTEKPLPPVALQAAWTAGGIQLDWQAPPSPVTGYRVYRSVDGGAPAFLAPALATTYLDAGADPAHAYAYYVTAVDGSQESAPSNVAMPAYPYCWNFILLEPPFIDFTCITPLPGGGPALTTLLGVEGGLPLPEIAAGPVETAILILQGHD